MSALSSWATYDPKDLGTSAKPYAVQNLVDGQWTNSKSTMEIIHPMDRDAPPIFTIPDTQKDEIQPFVESLRKCPKSGMHNPLKNPERYVQYGEISRRVRSRRAIPYFFEVLCPYRKLT
jgi:1-pyrroline-5-carboxylate dehydrogenase